MEPTQGGATVLGSETCLSLVLQCQAATEFWLDLDAAEAAHPGQFIGVPLVISLRAEWRGDGPDDPIAVDASLRARLEKK